MKLKTTIFLAICGLLVWTTSSQPYVSCAHVGLALFPHEVDGWYLMNLAQGVCFVYCKFGDVNHEFQVYTLFESFSFANEAQYFSLDFATDSPRHFCFSNGPFDDYRWPTANIDAYSSLNSVTHWLATCEMDTSMTNDFWLVNYNSYSYHQTTGPDEACLCCADDVVIRGHSCFATPPCDPPHWSFPTLHVHIDSGWASCTGHNTSIGELDFEWVADSVHSEDNFGVYWSWNPVFSCVTTPSSTTNFWFLQHYNPAMGGGDPHFFSLDGLKYNYDGPCSYIALTNKCKKKENKKATKYPLFEVLSHHGRCMRRQKGIVCIKKITVQFWKNAKSKVTKVEIESKENVMINDYEMKLPYHSDMFDITTEKYKIKKKEYKRVHFVSNFGLDLKWSNDGAGTFEVNFDSKIRTCGLLGNNNGNVKDDLELRNGTILKYKKLPMDEKISNIMGDSWMIKTKNQVLQCHLYPSHSMQYQPKSICSFDFTSVQDSCQQMIDRQSKELNGENVKKCFKEEKYDENIDTTRIYDDCITQVCSCKKDLFADCVPTIAIKGWKDACMKHGVHFFPQIVWEFD